MRSSTQEQAHPPDSDRTLVIMAKAPRLGAVKSRLARKLPAPAVLELYRCLLHDTVAVAQSLPGVHVAIMCPAFDADDLSRAVGDGVSVVPQKGHGLAAGLTSVFAHFATGQRRIIALNSDSPHLPGAVLLTAFDALASSDLVVGPTDDGGYYLVGAAASYPELFASSAMGTNSALETLLERANALGLAVSFTDPFYDIDEPSDLSRLAVELQIAPERAPRTANWLAGWRRGLADEHTSSIGAP
ncbi:MAG: TIGR04282 family arsenosugar biosynthesis glycosyltransferase [Acidobacteria bacterium]|nr:TIGR04282 family arsenosugar biosynthesis glycosyltransferase [Acidobacteriota bacterium]